MYIDKMIEYLVLTEIRNRGSLRKLRNYDTKKIDERMNELELEFLEPYAIIPNSRE